MDILAQIGATEDAELDIFEAALELAALDHAGVRLAPYRAHFDDIVSEAEDICNGLDTPISHGEALARAIAFNHGYSGDRDSYDDPANANLINVIDRRRGLPVALAVLYLGVARRLDWPAAALNVPAHLLIRVGDNDGHVVQDPFDDGRLLASGVLPPAFQALSAPHARPDIEAADLLPDRAVLVRMLNNTASRAEASGDMDTALMLHGRMTSLAPQYSGLWWERARLERSLGHLSAARTSLIHMLETTHDSGLSHRVNQMLASLARSVN